MGNSLCESDLLEDTDSVVSACPLIAITARGPEAFEIPLALLLFPVKGLQGLDEAVHAKTGGVLSILHARANDLVAVKADGSHLFTPRARCRSALRRQESGTEFREPQ
jgi:hypothetical protein